MTSRSKSTGHQARPPGTPWSGTDYDHFRYTSLALKRAAIRSWYAYLQRYDPTLPNPTDDADPDIPSDNPYATADDNYFVPEWPIARLPTSAVPRSFGSK